ncbi:MAG: peptidylprolyl isomerase [Thioalkalispiraceae bacterium]|jgi:FKBP-type peptidyl-prolyl cis-trans isomerase SlyD
MQISANKVVTIDYTLKDNDDQIIDESKNGEFAYLHGASNIIPGLESALDDKKSGDTLSVSIEPKDGYGDRIPSMTQVVSMDMFDTPEQVQVGQQFHAQGADGQDIMITVTNVDGDQVTIDGNHPLAGMQLNFDVTVIDVRDATEQEIEHGHVHAHGHDH